MFHIYIYISYTIWWVIPWIKYKNLLWFEMKAYIRHGRLESSVLANTSTICWKSIYIPASYLIQFWRVYTRTPTTITAGNGFGESGNGICYQITKFSRNCGNIMYKGHIILVTSISILNISLFLKREYIYKERWPSYRNGVLFLSLNRAWFKIKYYICVCVLHFLWRSWVAVGIYFSKYKY